MKKKTNHSHFFSLNLLVWKSLSRRNGFAARITEITAMAFSVLNVFAKSAKCLRKARRRHVWRKRVSKRRSMERNEWNAITAHTPTRCDCDKLLPTWKNIIATRTTSLYAANMCKVREYEGRR